MIGMPYRLLRHDDTGEVDKTVYLATDRYGTAKEAMKKAKAEYRNNQRNMGKAFQRYEAADRRVKELPADAPNMDELVEQREDCFDRLSEAEDAALAAAAKLVLLSLTENYGKKKAEEICELLTDSDLHDMMVTIQTGEQPKVFFQSTEQPPKQTSTSQPDGQRQEHSSNTASRRSRSRKEKSASTKPVS